MEDQLISFKVAKLAKEKGFDELCRTFYGYDSTEEEYNLIGLNSPSFINSRESLNKFNDIAAPTQSLLQRWFREVHNIHISINKVYEYQKTPAIFIGYCIYLSNDPYIELKINDKLLIMLFPSYEKALEIALQEAPKLIK